MKKYIVLLLLVSILLPKNIFAEELIPNAKSGILIEASTGKILYEKDPHTRLSIASMTKMVSQIIILENIEKGKIKWNDVVTVSKNAKEMGGSQIYLEEGEKITVEDLMKGISVASANDATVAMAEYISGSEENFVKEMNKKVESLGLKDTHFKNSTGLDEEGHYSTAYDMAQIAKHLLAKHKEILRFSSIYEDYIREDKENKFWLINTNKLINFYEGADGLKTGHTDDAKYCIAATAKRKNLRLIGIVLGEENSKIRNKEVMHLLDYGFSNIKMKILKRKNTTISKIKLEKSELPYLTATTKEDLSVIESNNSNKKYKYKIIINNIKYPIHKGQEIGNINALYNSKVVSSTPLISNSNITKIPLNKLILNNLFNIIIGN